MSFGAEVATLNLERAVAVVGNFSVREVGDNNIAFFFVERIISVVIKTGDSRTTSTKDDGCAFASGNGVEFDLVITCAAVEGIAGAAKECIITFAAGYR